MPSHSVAKRTRFRWVVRPSRRALIFDYERSKSQRRTVGFAVLRESGGLA